MIVENIQDSDLKNTIIECLTSSSNNPEYNSFLKADFIDTPIGKMLLICEDNSLYLLEFLERKAIFTEIKKLRIMMKSEITVAESKIGNFLKDELNLYFSGKLTTFKTNLANFGTKFNKIVWNELKNIPYGITRSYLDIAKQIGNPCASRAVAKANGMNQISLIIPCHRVIGSDGSLTGYAGGLWRKKWLLEHENKVTNK